MSKSRERLVDLASAREKLLQASQLARSAAGLLAELGVDGNGNVEPGIDLKAEIKLASDAGHCAGDAVIRLDIQIRKADVS